MPQTDPNGSNFQIQAAQKITRKRPKQFDDIHHILRNLGARNVGKRRITHHGENYRSGEDRTEASATGLTRILKRRKRRRIGTTEEEPKHQQSQSK